MRSLKPATTAPGSSHSVIINKSLHIREPRSWQRMPRSPATDATQAHATVIAQASHALANAGPDRRRRQLLSCNDVNVDFGFRGTTAARRFHGGCELSARRIDEQLPELRDTQGLNCMRKCIDYVSFLSLVQGVMRLGCGDRNRRELAKVGRTGRKSDVRLMEYRWRETEGDRYLVRTMQPVITFGRKRLDVYDAVVAYSSSSALACPCLR